MKIRQLQDAIAENRNELAYKELFILWYSSAVSFSRVITKNEEAAEEIYSDVMMKIWFMGEKLKTIDNLKTFLFVMLKNASLNYLKKTKIQTVSIEGINTDHHLELSVEQTIVCNEINTLINNAVNALPPKCLMVYKLIKEEGFSYKQTAEILGLSVNTIEGHMQNALQKISSYLKRSGLDI